MMIMGKERVWMNLSPQSQQNTAPLFDDIVSIRDTMLAETETIAAPAPVPGALSEAFALLDPDLAYLFKDMKSAATQLVSAQQSGQMVDMAQWRFDSAESAYKTRLMEVRKNKMMKKCAKKALNGEEEAAKRDLRNSAIQDEMTNAFNLRRKKLKEEKRRKEEGEGGLFFYVLLGMRLAQMAAQKRAKDMELSNIQNAFFNAKTGTV